MPETWSSTLLDYRASKTICREEWLTKYINNLKNTDQQKVIFGESNHTYRFGDGRKGKTIYSAKTTAIIGSDTIEIETDVVNNNIPLLFSKISMKKGCNIFNENLGHYAVPILNLNKWLTT